MGELLTTASTLMCPHGGSVRIMSANSRARAGGAFVARTTDTFIIGGCPFVTGSNPHPCMTVEWSTGAQRIDVLQADVLTTDSVGLCKAADGAAQGPVSVLSTQAKARGL